MENKNNKAMFIKTKDEETSKTLMQEGFELVDYTNGVWTFVNNVERTLIFEKNKVAYSNTICI